MVDTRNNTPPYRFYPTIEIIEGRGIIPNINLPGNFRELVPLFYQQKRREKVEEYIRKLIDGFRETSLEHAIELQWDENLGLTNIAVGVHSGLDLNDDYAIPHYQEHNLGFTNSLVAAMVAMKYISELLKVR